MTIIAKTAAAAAVVGLVAWPPVDAYAKKEAGDILVRLSGIAMIPNAGGGTINAPDTDLDPWVIGIGFGYAAALAGAPASPGDRGHGVFRLSAV